MRKLKYKFRKWFTWRKTYAQIWIYFACTCIGILLISTAFLYIFSSKVILNTISDYSETQLEANAENLASNMNWNIDYSQRSSSESIFKEQAFQNYEDSYQENLVWKRLVEVKENNPYIDSIYLINSYNQTIIDSKFGISALKNFYDQQIFQILKSTKTSMNQLIVPRLLESDPISNTKSRLITIVVPYEITNSSSAFVVNLNSDKLLSLSTRDTQHKNRELFIIDKSNVILSSNNESNFMHSFSPSYSTHFNNAQGSFEFNDTNSKQLIVYATASIRGLDQWRIVEIIPETTLLGGIRSLRIITTLFFICILIGTFLIILVISRKIYSPIQELVMNVTNKFNEPPVEQQMESEMSYLSKVFSEQNQKIDDYGRNQKYEKREAFLKELLETSNYPIIDRMQYSFKQYDIVLPLTSLAIAVFIMDHFYMFKNHYSDRDQRLLLYAISNIIKEHLIQFFVVETIIMENDHVAVIYHVENEILIATYNDAFRKCQSLIKQYLSLEMSIAIGSFIESYLELHESYLNTYELVNERFKLGLGAFITTFEGTEKAEREFQYPNSEEKQLLQTIRKGDLPLALKELENIWNYLKQGSYPECKLSITILCLNISKSIPQLIAQKLQNYNWTLSYIQDQVENLETMDAIYEWLSERLTEIIEEMHQSKKEPKYTLIIQEIKNEIHKNLEDQNLSSKWISDKMGLSVNYIRNLFKTETNQSIMEFISDSRIEKVKEKLIQTNLPVDLIINEFGFTSKVSFYSIFKKNCGTTPAIYRKENQKK